MCPVDLLGDAAPFLQDNMKITVDLVEGDPVGIHLPPTVVLEVVEADPVVKGQTAAVVLQAGQTVQRREDHRCRRSSRPARRSSSAPRTPATWSGSRADPDPRRWRLPPFRRT